MLKWKLPLSIDYDRTWTNNHWNSPEGLPTFTAPTQLLSHSPELLSREGERHAHSANNHCTKFPKSNFSAQLFFMMVRLWGFLSMLTYSHCISCTPGSVAQRTVHRTSREEKAIQSLWVWVPSESVFIVGITPDAVLAKECYWDIFGLSISLDDSPQPHLKEPTVGTHHKYHTTVSAICSFTKMRYFTCLETVLFSLF